MEVTVIDTLRYADRLKAAGVQPNQAEAMSRALNDELTAGVATKDDLGHAVDTLDGKLASAVERLETRIGTEVGRLETKIETDIGHLETKIETDIGHLETKIETDIGRLETKIETDIGRLETKIETDIGHAVTEMKGELDTMDTKFDAMDEKFDALRDRVDTQGRYVFMVLALIAALGIYNAVSPHIVAKAPSTADAKPAVAAAQRPDA